MSPRDKLREEKRRAIPARSPARERKIALWRVRAVLHFMRFGAYRKPCVVSTSGCEGGGGILMGIGDAP